MYVHITVVQLWKNSIRCRNVTFLSFQRLLELSHGCSLAAICITLLLLPGIFHWQFILSPCYYCKVFSTDSPLYRIATTAKQCPLTALSIIVATTDRYCPLAAPCITLLQLPGIVSLAAFRATMYYSQVLFTGSHLYCAAKAVLSTDSTLYNVATTARYCIIGNNLNRAATTAWYCSLGQLFVSLQLYCPLIALRITLLQLQGIVALAASCIPLLLSSGI